MFFLELKKDIMMPTECDDFVGLVNDPIVKENMTNI